MEHADIDAMTSDQPHVLSMTPKEFGEYLEHFGVKGMKWGVRRSNKQLAKAAKLRTKADKAEAKAGGKGSSKPDSKGRKKISDLSDQELRQKLNRMNMEQQYAKLTAPKANPLTSAGKSIVANAAKGVMQTSLQAVGQSYATKYTAQYMANAAKPSFAPKLPSRQGPLRPPSPGGR